MSRPIPRPRARACSMLSSEEWRFVRNAPLVGFLIVAGADGTVSSLERRALVDALETGKGSACGLFQAVCRRAVPEARPADGDLRHRQPRAAIS